MCYTFTPPYTTCICVIILYMYRYILVFVCLIYVYRSGLKTLSIPRPQFFISKYHAPIKRSSLGEMADFRAGPEKVQYEPRTSCCAKKQESTQRMLETCQRDTSQLERAPIGQ